MNRSLSLLLVLALPLSLSARVRADMIVSTGYADVPGVGFPSPWAGSPNTTFYKSTIPDFGPGDPDQDGVLFQNTGSSNIPLTALHVGSHDLFADDVGVPSTVIIRPGTFVVFEGLDGSDGLGSGTIVSFTLNGQNFQFTDPNGSGFEGGALRGHTPDAGNESLPWQQGADIPFGSSAVPEPASLTSLVMGIVGVGVYGWRRRNRRETGGAAGSGGSAGQGVGCQDRSGDRNRLGHITREGAPGARQLVAEAAWQARRRSPAVRAYFERVQRGDPQRKEVAPVATAHNLVRVMWSMLEHGTAWEEKPARAN